MNSYAPNHYKDALRRFRLLSRTGRPENRLMFERAAGYAVRRIRIAKEEIVKLDEIKYR